MLRMPRPTSSRLLALLILAGLCATPAAGLEALPDLDGFLGGIERQCRGSDAFEHFVTLLAERHVPAFRPAQPYRKVPLPDGVRAALGQETALDRGNHVLVTVPLLGTFRGLRVKALEIAVRHGTAPPAVAIVFAASTAEVRGILPMDPRLPAGSKAGVASLIDLSGEPKLVCNPMPEE